ncbi:MAG: hypothetical protein HOH43_03170 [Candidatus Latescibacteria bacterium]|nr:hypothetical protein [Candidatus Latescibacterota bacterium]
MNLDIPGRLANTCKDKPDNMAWLKRLPVVVEQLADTWSLDLGSPYDSDEVSCAWVAPVKRADGSSAVLKIGMPHMEAEHEIQGLQYWDGDPTAYLFEADVARNAMLMEHCVPGTVLRSLPESEQDEVIATLLCRLWRQPSRPHPFRSIARLKRSWSEEDLLDPRKCLDSGLVRAGLQLFDELLDSTEQEVILATDLHAGNVVRAQRHPWLVIDPKPFLGDPAFDATQHLFNCDKRLLAAPAETIGRFADLLSLPPERIRQWLFARASTEAGCDWPGLMDIARALQ